MTTSLEVALAAWLPSRRWFGGKGRPVERVVLVDRAALPGPPPVWLYLIDVQYGGGRSERYSLPLTPAAERPPELAGVEIDGRPYGLADALVVPAACRTLLEAVAAETRATTQTGGTVAFERGPALARLLPAALTARAAQLGAEQSNSSVEFGRKLLLKCFRRVYDGPNPDFEVPRFLATRTRFDRLPALAGAAQYLAAGGSPASLLIAQEFVESDGDGWSFTLASLAERDRAEAGFSEVDELGRVTAELHLALAGDSDDSDFAPDPVDAAAVAAWRTTVQDRVAAGLERLGEASATLSGPAADLADRVLAGRRGLEVLVDGLADWPARGTVAIRYHGDYHLGQVLHARRGWLVLDFEGEPLRPLPERRAKGCPLRDVAGMLRSFNYAAETARRERLTPEAWLAGWEQEARRRFLSAYLERAGGLAPFLPADEAVLRRAITAFEVEKAAYELEYELNNRPDWVSIPLQFLAAVAV